MVKGIRFVCNPSNFGWRNVLLQGRTARRNGVVVASYDNLWRVATTASIDVAKRVGKLGSEQCQVAVGNRCGRGGVAVGCVACADKRCPVCVICAGSNTNELRRATCKSCC